MTTPSLLRAASPAYLTGMSSDTSTRRAGITGGGHTDETSRRRRTRQPGLASWLRAVEAPTWALAAGIYGGFAALTWWWQALPLVVVCAALAYLVCLHAHLAHEILHGHPTRSRRINEAIVGLPLQLWLPYPIYRDTHLAHHGVSMLTHPVEDPESFYVTDGRWAEKPWPARQILRWNQSFLGRLVIGPWLMVPRFWAREIQRLASGDRRYRGAWAVHLAMAAVVLTWVVAVCGMPAWLYALGVVYPSVSLTLMRSYVEHRPGASQDERTAIVEGGPLTQLLFLNNNFHLVHHAKPAVPWYDIPRLYRGERERWLARNAGYRYRSYIEVARRHLLAPKDSPVHPTVL